jgi:SAM-dependent methyltransferase
MITTTKTWSDREESAVREDFSTGTNNDGLHEESVEFDPQFYLSYYSDLQGLSEEEAYQHWLKFGYPENRVCSEAKFYQRLGISETDLPTDFDYQNYLYLNPDIAEVYQDNKYKTIQHFVRYGLQEKREYRLDSARGYLKLGNQLGARQKWDEAIVAYRQAINLNINVATPYFQLAKLLRQKNDDRGAFTVYQALQETKLELSQQQQQELEDNLKAIADLSETENTEVVFDGKFYLEYHEDLQDLATLEQAYEHWLTRGKAENRLASEVEFYHSIDCKKSDLPQDFNYQDYLDLNPDLKRIFGSSKYQAIAHFLQYGSKEGRSYNRNSAKKKHWISFGSQVHVFDPDTQFIFNKVAEKFGYELQNVSHSPIPPRELLKSSGSHNLAHYRDNMLFYTKDVIQHCLLKRNSRVLDLGCGAGRISRGLLHYLNRDAIYVGVDVNAKAIDWCQKNITPRNANFAFQHLDLVNNYYYCDDNQQHNSYDFGFLGEQKFDCIIAICLFNHLKLNDTQQYLREIAKRLAKDSVAYLTFFTIDQDFTQFRNRTGLHTGLQRGKDGVWQGYQYHDFFVGYETEMLENLFSEAGLNIMAASPGSWAEKANSRIYQDWYLVTAV